MSRPVSLAVKPPGANKSTWSAPSQRMFADDSDEEGDAFTSASGSRPKSRVKAEDERIEGFGNGRRVNRRPPEPLVIAALPNRDWRAVTTQARRPGYRPERRDDEPVVTHERTGDEPQRRGLRRAGDIDPDYDNDRKPAPAELAAAETKPETKPEVKEEERKPLTLDEEALAAVLAGDDPVSDEQRLADDLVIESAADRNVLTEDQALERHLDALPEESTLDDYDAVPVEAFGAAMLRGMGYDAKNDTPMHVPKPRPALLGIGATALSSELPPSRKDPKKRREERATRGGRGFNAAALLVRSNGPSREASIAREDSREASRSRGTSPGEKRRRDDDDSRDSKRRYDNRDDRDRRRTDERDTRDRDRDGRRYETEEERARRKAREHESNRDRDDRRDRDRDRERSRRDDRDRDRGRYEDRNRRERDRDRNRDRP
ncbi:hypothetical protein CspHIS471_0408040 [Cutaneotrichosporon sp. HIS471]|nr:hypothetical protein CspHIS471_0408040 [Cutaneotrichosporon sp. HIS471]